MPDGARISDKRRLGWCKYLRIFKEQFGVRAMRLLVFSFDDEMMVWLERLTSRVESLWVSLFWRELDGDEMVAILHQRVSDLVTECRIVELEDASDATVRAEYEHAMAFYYAALGLGLCLDALESAYSDHLWSEHRSCS